VVLSLKVPVAANCCEEPSVIVGVSGVTDTLTIVAVEIVNVAVAVIPW